MSASADYVVDASAAAPLFFPEPLTPNAAALFGMLDADPAITFHVPDLFFVECANIFWKAYRAKLATADEAIQAVERLLMLRLTPTPTSALVDDAIRFATALDITAYDASYAALAARLAAPLITADDRLARKLGGGPPVIRSLASISVPPAPAP